MTVPVVAGNSLSVWICSHRRWLPLKTVKWLYPYVLDRKAEYAGWGRVKGSWSSWSPAHPLTMYTGAEGLMMTSGSAAVPPGLPLLGGVASSELYVG